MLEVFCGYGDVHVVEVSMEVTSLRLRVRRGVLCEVSVNGVLDVMKCGLEADCEDRG